MGNQLLYRNNLSKTPRFLIKAEDINCYEFRDVAEILILLSQCDIAEEIVFKKKIAFIITILRNYFTVDL